jgi:hypothetical protein
VTGQDELRVGGNALELLAEGGDAHVNRAALRQRVVAPDLVQELAAGEERPAMLDEVAQELELHAREGTSPRGEVKSPARAVAMALAGLTVGADVLAKLASTRDAR